jgi:uncharacterized membrane protein YfcA
MDPSTSILVITILFVSALTRSTLGFGDALLAMPLLALAVDIKTAAPLVALVSLTIALSILAESWRQVDLRDIWRLIAASLVGIPFGLLLLKDAPESIVKGLLGIILILYGLYNLTAPRLPTLKRKELAYVAGFVAGVLGGAYNTSGPPVIVYGTLRRWPPERFRATLQGYFASSVFVVIGHGLAGLWTANVLKLYAVALPVVVLAIVLGSKLNRSVPHGRFDRVVYMALVVMGGLLLI